MKKNIFAAVLALSLAATAVAPTTDAFAANSVASAAKKALTAKAESLALESAKEYAMSTEYGFYDMDKDGVKELVFGYIGNREGIEVYRYDQTKKKVVQAKLPKDEQIEDSSTISGVTSLKKAAGGGFIVVASGGAAYGVVETYTLGTDGNLKGSKVFMSDYFENKFTKDGKTISQKSYEKYLDKVLSKKDVVLNKTVKEADRVVRETQLSYKISTRNLDEILGQYSTYNTMDVNFYSYDSEGKMTNMAGGEGKSFSYKKGEGYGTTKIGKFDLMDIKLLEGETLESYVEGTDDDENGAGSETYYTVLDIKDLQTVIGEGMTYGEEVSADKYDLIGLYVFSDFGGSFDSATFFLKDKTSGEKKCVAVYNFLVAE